MNRRWILCLWLAAILGWAVEPAAQEPSETARTETTARKKLIEWGWDEPDPHFLREHIREMEQLPFDGLVFHVNSNRGGNFSWEMWGGRRFELSEFDQAVIDLRATEFRRFTERFLRVNVTPGTVDWFDDENWQGVLHNIGVAAQVAKRGDCTGLLFDVEQYQHPLFDYRKQPQRPFVEVQQQVRRRGQEWMREVNRHFPDITILLTFGYRLAHPRKATSRAGSAYGLLADFLDGMLEACSDATRLVDAWEFSYGYKQPEQFRQAYQTITGESLQWTAVPEEYRKHVRAGFGLWLDYDWRRRGWSIEDPSTNYFSPDEFERAVRAALAASDEYVWIYTEQPRWWPREKLPAAYVEALRKARAADDVSPQDADRKSSQRVRD